MKRIVLASNNKHKIKEFREIFSDFEIVSLSDIGFNEEIEETGQTFRENSLIKARAVREYLNKINDNSLIIADDSGLCVNALNGEPGVYSARYSGDHNDKKNREKLLDSLKNVKDRSAYFECVLAVLNERGDYLFAEGRTNGVITKEERGDTSFGYDCLFYSNSLNKTFGEATQEEKNSVSHRGRAIEKLKTMLSI